MVLKEDVTARSTYLTSHIFCVKMQFAYPFRTFETILTNHGFRWLLRCDGASLQVVGMRACHSGL